MESEERQHHVVDVQHQACATTKAQLLPVLLDGEAAGHGTTGGLCAPGGGGRVQRVTKRGNDNRPGQRWQIGWGNDDSVKTFSRFHNGFYQLGPVAEHPRCKPPEIYNRVSPHAQLSAVPRLTKQTHRVAERGPPLDSAVHDAAHAVHLGQVELQQRQLGIRGQNHHLQAGAAGHTRGQSAAAGWCQGTEPAPTGKGGRLIQAGAVG